MSTLQDDRPRGWFHIDNVVVDEYLPRIGHTPYILYTYLVRKSDRAGVSWPSYTTMQKTLGIGRNQVAAALKVLVENGLLTIEKGEKAAVNRYHLIAVGSLAGKLVSPENQSRSETETSFPARLEVVSQRDSIKTHRSRPKYQDVPRVPDGFAEFLAEYPRRDARAMAERAWKKLTDEERERAVSALAVWKECDQWQDVQFVPQASTYLNQRRFDETPPKSSSATRKPMSQADHNQSRRNPDGTPKLVY